MTSEIYALHEGVNAYDHEGTYIRYIWFRKPSMFDVAAALQMKFPCDNDEHTLAITKIWQGQSMQFRPDGSDWQVLKHGEGKVE